MQYDKPAAPTLDDVLAALTTGADARAFLDGQAIAGIGAILEALGAAGQALVDGGAALRIFRSAESHGVTGSIPDPPQPLDDIASPLSKPAITFPNPIHVNVTVHIHNRSKRDDEDEG